MSAHTQRKWAFSLSLLGLIWSILPEFIPQFTTDWPSGQSTFTEAQALWPPTPRAAITFILGTDKDHDNPYFTHASQYYEQQAHPGDRIITDLRSLTDCYDYLCSHPPASGRPWQAIRLVVHSNPWMGMSVAATPGQRRTTLAQLNQLVEQGHYGPLSEDIADGHTQLQLWGCGLGENTALLERLAEFWGLEQVISPLAFVQYEQDDFGVVRRALNQVYYTTYPTGYHPGNWALRKQLAKAYPDASTDWQAALTAQTAVRTGRPYSHTFKIPVTWVVTYPSSEARPKVKNATQQHAWLQEQTLLQHKLQQLGLAQSEFTWTTYPTQCTFPDGAKEPAVKAIGLCQVVCVLVPIADPESGQGSGYRPLEPSLMDGGYFTCMDVGS